MLRINNFKWQNKDFLIIAIVALLYYLQQIMTVRLGINYEEGLDANAYILATQGYLPYRDFEWIYGPFSFLIYPFILKLFGIQLMVLRISYVIFVSVIIPLTYFLARRLMPAHWAGLASFLSVIFLKTPYYTINHVFSVWATLGCLLMICRFIESNRKIFKLFWAGIFTSIAILNKPLMAGISLFVGICLFLWLFNWSSSLRNKLKYFFYFSFTTVSLILIYLLFFYYQTKIKNIYINYPYFSNLFVHSYGINLRLLVPFFKRLILPIRQLIYASSLKDFKTYFVVVYDNFIFALPFIVSLAIAFIYIILRFCNIRLDIKDKIYRDKNFLTLFVISCILISLEGLSTAHVVGRAYTNQVPFILTIYILYITKKTFSYRSVIITTFITFFLFYLIGLDFIHYPYSFIKRYRKYTQPLNLERTRGILVTVEEKKLYESLASYLSLNIGNEGKMAIVGYYPQISLLTKKKNIFGNEEFLFQKIEFLIKRATKKERAKRLLVYFEDKIITKIQEERPGIVIDVTDDLSRSFESASLKIKEYIEKNYYLDNTIGPADVQGMGGYIARVNLYKLREQ